MSLLYIDGFDYGDTAMRWVAANGAGAPSTTTRFNLGRSWTLSNQVHFSTRAITPSATVYLGVALRVSAANAASYPISFMGDSGATEHLTVRITNSNDISLYRGATVLGTYTHIAPFAGNWFYIELGATIADAGGTATVRLDGVPVIAFSGDTRNGGTLTNIDAIRLAGSNSGPVYFDDLYVLNSLGSTNNTFLGEVRVQTLSPAAAGSSTQFTPTGSASNWQNTSDIPYNTARYNASPTVGQRDLYGMGDLLATTSTVYGAQDIIHASKSDAGAISIKPAIKSGGTVYYGAAQTLGLTPAAYVTPRENDPATSVVWTISGINAAEYGAEVA